MKILGIVFLVAALVLLAWGLDANGSLQSDFTRLFRGGPTHRTLWLFLGSACAGTAGLGLLVAPQPRTA